MNTSSSNPAQVSASAETHRQTIMVPQIVETKLVRIQLEVTPEQAENIRAMTSRIGGYPNGTRGVFDKLSNALAAAGVRWKDSRDALEKHSGSLYFNDGSA